jgi:hypothetical protein
MAAMRGQLACKQRFSLFTVRFRTHYRGKEPIRPLDGLMTVSSAAALVAFSISASGMEL